MNWSAHNAVRKAKALTLGIWLGACFLGAVWALPAGEASPGMSTGPKDDSPEPVPPRPTLPDEIRQLIDATMQARADFLQRQQALKQELEAGTTAEQRQRVRNQMHDERAVFVTEMKAREQEIHERLAELRAQFKNNRDQLINAAKAPNRGPRGR